MALPYSFTSNTSPTGAQLDANEAALGALTIVPCLVSGTNSLTLTPLTDTPAVAAYGNYMVFSGIAAASNTGGVTANIGAVGALFVYKDTPAGPVALSGGEIIAGNVILLLYDTALNGGSGGFHLLPTLTPQLLSATNNITSSVGTTLLAADLTGNGTRQGIITRAGAPSGGYNDTTDTAAAILSSISPVIIGSSFRFRVVNTSGQTQTLLGGTSVTIAGASTTATGASHDFIGQVTNVTAAAVTIYG